MHSLPPVSIPRWDGTFVTVEEPTGKRHCPQALKFLLGFTHGIVRSMGFDKCIVTCVH